MCEAGMKKAVTNKCNCLIFSGATRNRHFYLSGCISYRYVFKKEVISRYCSTKFLHYFAAKFFTTHFLLQIYEESS